MLVHSTCLSPLCHGTIRFLMRDTAGSLVNDIPARRVVGDTILAPVRHASIIVVYDACRSLVYNHVWIAPMINQSIPFLMHCACGLLKRKISVSASTDHTVTDMVGDPGLVVLDEV